jgi:hypothetical protein
MNRTLVRFGVAAVTMAGCGAGERAADAGVVIRDSAGITIVENTRAAWSGGEAWRLSAEPLVRIGVLDGPEEYQFFQAFSALRLGDGRIVVANRGSSELRFYDAGGRFLFAAGRAGEGPGEFRDLQRVWALPGDSLLALDFMPARLSVFDGSGAFARSFSIRSPDGRQALIQGPFDDGTLFVTTAPIWDAPDATPGSVRTAVPYLRFDREGALLDTIGQFPSGEAYRRLEAQRVILTGLPFGRTPVREVAGDRLHFGAATTYEIDTYSPDGRLIRRIRLDREPRPVSSADVAAFRAHRLEWAERSGTRASMERFLAEMPYPETMPPYSRLLVDAQENLWVREYQPEWETGSTWRVFDAGGRYLGAEVMPDKLEPYQIGRDFVLGRALDDLDVESIVLYGLEKRP